MVVPAIRLAALLCHADVSMACACLATVQHQSRDPLTLTLISDGSLQHADVEYLHAALGDFRYVDRPERDDLTQPYLHQRPALARYRREHPFGVKLVDVPVVMGQADFVYCDSDIVALAPFSGLAPPAEVLGFRGVFMRDPMSTYCLGTRRRNLLWTPAPFRRLAAHLNAGLYWLGADFYDLDFLEALVRTGYQRGYHVPLLEQTAWAALAGRHPCALYDPQRVSFPLDRHLGARPVLVHFGGPWRPLLHDETYHAAITGDATNSADPFLSSPPLALTYVPTQHETWWKANLQAHRTRRAYRSGCFAGYEPLPARGAS